MYVEKYVRILQLDYKFQPIYASVQLLSRSVVSRPLTDGRTAGVGTSARG